MELLFILAVLLGPMVVTLPIAAYVTARFYEPVYNHFVDRRAERYGENGYRDRHDINKDRSSAKCTTVWLVIAAYAFAVLWPFIIPATIVAIANVKGNKKARSVKEREKQLALDEALVEKHLAKLRREGALPPAIEV